MGCRLVLLIFIVFAAWPERGLTQHQALDGMEERESGQAYARSIRFTGVQSDIAYFDPTRPPPPFETRETPRSEDSTNGEVRISNDSGRGIMIVITSLLVLGAVFLFVQFGGRLPVAFSRAPSDGDANSESRRSVGGSDDGHALPASLEAILGIGDRKLALVTLCKALLAQTIAAQGILFQRSWTDRDALRRVPADLDGRGALQELVYASERVQFGGREVSEQEFRDHLDLVQPIWRAAAP
ncbi:MAG: DUF4129 domain-containing protein [Pseudomonadota bacterium]